MKTIDRFFGMLRRLPTDAELAEWSPRVAVDDQATKNTGGDALSLHLLTSTEYLDRVS